MLLSDHYLACSDLCHGMACGAKADIDMPTECTQLQIPRINMTGVMHCSFEVLLIFIYVLEAYVHKCHWAILPMILYHLH